MRNIIFQHILESIPVGLLVIDSNGEVVTVNRAASSIVGRPKEFMEGRGWGEIFFESGENDAFNQVFLDVIQERGMNLRREVDYRQPSGRTLRLSVGASFLQENEELAGIVVVLDDVTESHAMRQREKAILQEKSRVQREKAESLVQLSMAVAHQLRNPMMSIGGFARLLLKDAPPESFQSRYLQSILGGARRLEEIVKAVEDYANLPPMAPRKVPLEELVGQCRAFIDSKASEWSRRFQWKLELEPAEVCVDPFHFPRALNELLLNALESLKGEGGVIGVRARREDGALSIRIWDSGRGIPARDQPFVRDPFFTTKARGVGMGICKAQRIINEHRGRLLIESSPGEGTCVTIRLG